MTDYTILLGSEEVSRAGHNMQGAAEQMQRAADQFDNTVDRLIAAMREHTATPQPLAAAPQSPESQVHDAVLKLSVQITDVGRVWNNSKALVVYFNGDLTDDDFRILREALRESTGAEK